MKLAGGMLVLLVATLALASPLDDSHRAALFRRTRIGPKDAAITRLAAAHERQLRVAAVGGNLSSFSDYFLAHLRTHNAAVGFAFDQWGAATGAAAAAAATEPAFYDEVEGIDDDPAVAVATPSLTQALNPPPPATDNLTHTSTDTNTTTPHCALPAKVWVYKHEDQSRPGIPVADNNQDPPVASGEVSARAAKPPAKESPALPASPDDSSTPAAGVPSPGKPGLNRLFARKKYSPLLRSDGSLKGAASESATTVPSSTESAADSGAPSDGPGTSVATSTRRTRPTRPGKVPRVTSPKPTVSVKPTKISSRFSKPTSEPTDSTVTPVTQRTTRGRRTRPSKPPKGGPVPVSEAASTTSTVPPTTSTTTTTTTTTPAPTTSTTSTSTTTVGPSTSTAADPVVLVEGTSVVHSSVRGESSSPAASPATTVTTPTTPTTSKTTSAAPPSDADDDDEVPAPITTNGQQQPSEPVARPDRDRDDETLVFSRAPSGSKSDRVIPVVERHDDASAEDDGILRAAASFERK